MFIPVLIVHNSLVHIKGKSGILRHFKIWFRESQSDSKMILDLNLFLLFNNEFTDFVFLFNY